MFIFLRTSVDPEAGSPNPWGSIEHRLRTTDLDSYTVREFGHGGPV